VKSQLIQLRGSNLLNFPFDLFLWIFKIIFMINNKYCHFTDVNINIPDKITLFAVSKPDNRLKE